MHNFAVNIKEILKKRHEHLPKVLQEIERWSTLDSEISLLEGVVQELRDHPRTPNQLKDGLRDFQTNELRKKIADALALLRVVEARFSRTTINIGVSGVARVGKSTLLQSISGLSDEQIPVGKGDPVTAVRSRIFHSKSNCRATLLLHSFESFRDLVLRPYAFSLGLNVVPDSLGAFRTWTYPQSEDDLPKEFQTHSNSTMLVRLLAMQKALPSYQGDLSGGERIVGFEELRPFVAYPLHEDEPRRYLAVRDVKIECPFPKVQVESLGIIDLPGLGEIAADADNYHLNGLQNEVDLVVLVKRPLEGMAFWKTEDGKTASLLDKARGFVKNRRDFVFVLINSGGADLELCASLRKSIRMLANDGEEGKNFLVLEADAADQVSVEENVINPLLAHLSMRLPVMDQDVLEGTKADYISLTSMILTSLKDIESVLTCVSTISPSTAEDLEHRGEELRKDLAASLGDLVVKLRSQARSSEETPEYLSAIDLAYEEILSWISNGFGVGLDAWQSKALRSMQAEHNSSPFAATELNRIRVEISNRYCSIDNFFNSRVNNLWSEIAAIFRKGIGELASADDGKKVLKQLRTLMNDASEKCPTLCAAIDDLLALRLEYRTHLHPYVRRELDRLNLQVMDTESGEYKDQIVVAVSEAGAEELYRRITALAEQAAYYTRRALIREAVIPALVLHAAAEQFDDSLIRSGDSLREFKRLARSYHDDIWPGVFNGIIDTNARFAKVIRAIRTIREQLGTLDVGEK